MTGKFFYMCGSLRKPSSPAKPRAHATMPKINRFTIHQWAPAHDARNATSRAFLHCRGRHAPVTERSMKPHAADAPLDGLAHDGSRHVGMGCDHHAIDVAGNAGKV